MTTLLDTNVISEMLRPVDHAAPELLAWLERKRSADLCLSRISDSEFQYGCYAHPDHVQGRHLQDGWDRICTGVAMLEFDDTVADSAARFRALRKRMGRPVFFADAGIAMANDCALATRNMKDFEGSDLILVNPFEPPEG